jgi:hypothetical protein
MTKSTPEDDESIEDNERVFHQAIFTPLDIGVLRCALRGEAGSEHERQRVAAILDELENTRSGILVRPEDAETEVEDDEYAKCYTTMIFTDQLEVLRSALRGEPGPDDERQRVGYIIEGFADTTFLMLLLCSDRSGLGLTWFKIPSGELTNLPYLRHIGRLEKPVIMSTGMATLGDIEAAIDALEKAGTSRDLITVLHCTTEYPMPMQDVNLRAMVRLRDAFGVAVGYSDHTPGIEVAIAAVSLGATVIEKHFTMSRDLPGPDHKASLEPNELKDMVQAIRNIEIALGDGVKRLTASEARNEPFARKSLVAACAIAAGEPFSEANVTVKRPGTGVSPMRWDDMLRRRAPRDFEADELIEL